MRASAVIGAGFGDEGKGHVVDYLSEHNTIVVRFNGGAQAGHTVEWNGRRQVFHHFGSGAFKGASTYLSQFFIVNPLLWQLEKSGRYIPTSGTMVHHDAPLTTPYDMLVNQEVENVRGVTRHGSCGAGINETITRNQDESFKTTASDMLDRARLRDVLDRIRKSYTIPRLAKLTGLPPSDKFLERINSDGILEAYMKAVEQFVLFVGFIRGMPKSSHYVFEGAQGLLLDEQHHFFPHVTRSRPGLPNVLELCDEARIQDLEVLYVTRAYMTRHGAGPFPTEDQYMKYTDLTNAPNEFQGSLRFGNLDTRLIAEAVNKDLSYTDLFKTHVDAGFAVTCLDQVSDKMRLQTYEMMEEIDLPAKITSWGPDRFHIGREVDWPAVVRRGGW